MLLGAGLTAKLSASLEWQSHKKWRGAIKNVCKYGIVFESSVSIETSPFKVACIQVNKTSIEKVICWM